MEREQNLKKRKSFIGRKRVNSDHKREGKRQRAICTDPEIEGN